MILRLLRWALVIGLPILGIAVLWVVLTRTVFAPVPATFGAWTVQSHFVPRGGMLEADIPVRATLAPDCINSTQFWIISAKGVAVKVTGERSASIRDPGRVSFSLGVPDDLPSGLAQFYVVDVYGCRPIVSRARSPAGWFVVDDGEAE